MHSSNHKSHPSIASSLTKAGNTSAAIRRGKLEISDPIPIPQEDMSQLDPRVNDGRQGYPSSTSFAKTDTWPRRSTPTALQDSSQQDSHDGARIVQASNTDNNFNRTSAALTNTHQSMSSLPSGGMVGKRGGVRATFRRMFGSKRRRDSFATGVHDQRSHSVSLLDSLGSTHRPSRKPSLLFEELIRGRALNSHAPSVISPEPIKAHTGTGEGRRPLIDGFSRRNSLPSIVLSPQEAERLQLALNQHGIGASYNKGLPRPLRRIPHRSLIDSVRRKSRSADALRDMARSQNTLQAQERRLSDEIKYWRNSVIEDPIPSLASRQQEASEEKVQPTLSISSQTPTPSQKRPSSVLPAPPQAFDFNDFVVGDVDASVEQRITTVEVKLIDLECAIANLQGCGFAKPVVLERPPRRRQALPELSQRANTRSFSSPALYPKSSFESFSSHSSTSEDTQDSYEEHRNSVADTLRPAIAAQSDASLAVGWPPLPSQTHHAIELARLASMLSQEQEARRGLENQLKDLRKQISDLRFPAAPRGPPTPGHFSTPTSTALDSSPITTKRSTVSPFRTASPRLTLRSLSSQKENEEEETDTDDGFLDVYETPTEAKEYGFGIEVSRSPPMVGVM